MQIKTNSDEEFKTITGPFDKVVPVPTGEEKKVPNQEKVLTEEKGPVTATTALAEKEWGIGEIKKHILFKIKNNEKFQMK